MRLMVGPRFIVGPGLAPAMPDCTLAFIRQQSPAVAGEEKEPGARPESPPGSLAIALRQGDAVP